MGRTFIRRYGLIISTGIAVGIAVLILTAAWKRSGKGSSLYMGSMQADF